MLGYVGGLRSPSMGVRFSTPSQSPGPCVVSGVGVSGVCARTIESLPVTSIRSTASDVAADRTRACAVLERAGRFAILKSMTSD